MRHYILSLFDYRCNSLPSPGLLQVSKVPDPYVLRNKRRYELVPMTRVELVKHEV